MRNVADYRLLLEAYYGFIQPLEGVIRQHIGDGHFNIEQRLRAPKLEVDLTFLGSTELDKLPEFPDFSFVHDEASALGSLYVLEGSTLGGTFIVQMIRHKFPLENGLLYFAGYGDNNTTMWTEFTQVLNKEHSTVFQDKAVNAANTTFNNFDNWLQQQLQPLLTSNA